MRDAPRRKRTRTNFNQAADVLQGLLEKGNSPLSAQFQRYRLRVDWPKVIGQSLAEVCYPCGFNDGLLYICVKNSTWLNNLYYSRKEFVKKVNAYAGQKWISEVKFILNPKDVPADLSQLEDRPVDSSP